MASEIIRLWLTDPLDGATEPEVLPALATRADAQLRAVTIRVGIEKFAAEIVPHIAQAYLCRDWQALGYESWEAYVRGEFGLARLRLPRDERRQAVGTLRLYGMSTRAIASAVGTDQKTVVNDLRATEANSSVARPVTGVNGKRYAPSRPPSTRDIETRTAVQSAAPSHPDGVNAGRPDALRDARPADPPAGPGPEPAGGSATNEALSRREYAAALRRAAKVWQVDPVRVAEAFATPDDRIGLQVWIRDMREWCDRVSAALDPQTA